MARITKDPETRRKEFIGAARELFMEKGFEQTSISDITGRLGMSHGSFFYYFKSKNDVMKAVICDILNYWKEFMDNLVANEEMNGLEKMQLILQMSIESSTVKQDINEFFEKEGNAAMYQEYRKRSHEIIMPLITEIVEQGVEEGIFDLEFPKETVEYVGYILQNLGSSLRTSNVYEYRRKIRALEIFLTRVAGIGKNEFSLLGSEEKMKSSQQEKYWDKLAEEKEFPTPFHIEEFEKYASRDMNILDVGCGYGRTLNKLYNNGFKNLSGVDYSQGMIDRGLKLYPHLNLIKNDGDKIPFPDGEFDSVLLIGVLTSNVEDDAQENLISEISRVLKGDGILYIADFLINQDERNLKRYQKYEDEYGIYGVFKLDEGLVLRHHTEEHILELIKDYKKVVFEKTVYETMNGHKSNGFYYLGKKQQLY
jgi:AcrR family transcriptional regulator/ubiquinone/menaquinone biosynthesis C-methylase UbiE